MEEAGVRVRPSSSPFQEDCRPGHGRIPPDPPIPKRFFQDIALIGDAGREVVIEIPAIP